VLARLRRLPLLDASVVALGALVIFGAIGRVAAPAQVVRSYPPALVIPAEISYKADLVEKLPQPPQLIFYGGSRSERFDPLLAQRLTGLSAFNFAVSNGRPEGAWAIADWLYSRSPGTRLRWVWGIQGSTFYNRPFDPGLLQDPRFSRSFPADVLAEQQLALPHTPAEMPKGSVFTSRRWTARGLQTWNAYDSYVAHGRGLDASLAAYAGEALRKLAAEAPHGSAQSVGREYFEKTIGLLNAHGTTPVIVLMPTQPDVLAVLAAAGALERRDQLLAYLRGLSPRYRLRIVDLTEISSFGGDPVQFYDGVHMMRANADRALRAIVREADGALK
jgi:hypothetical protein